MHNNMITINGQKMGKSLGNFITLDEFFTGNHPLLQQAYSPMTIRFFILQAHYRSTVDFSNEALQASEKAYNRLMEGWNNLAKITPAATSTIDVKELRNKCYEAMNDDLSTPIVISHLFDGVRIINTVLAGNATLSQADLDELRETMRMFMFDILGLVESNQADNNGNEAFGKAIELLLEMRRDAKARKDWATSDLIRDRLSEIGFELKDTKEGTEWKLK
jgi:cysteinyl-tRNA synthetase